MGAGDHYYQFPLAPSSSLLASQLPLALRKRFVEEAATTFHFGSFISPAVNIFLTKLTIHWSFLLAQGKFQ